MPERIKELRVQKYTTFNTTFLAPNVGTGAWNRDDISVTGLAVSTRPSTTYTGKLSVVAVDTTGLDHVAIENAEIQQKMSGNPAPVKGPKQGNFKFTTYMGKAAATIYPPIQAELLEAVMGGRVSPNATTCPSAADRVVPIYGASQIYQLTITKANAANIINTALASAVVFAGQGVLIGARGDGRGEGQVRIVRDETTNSVTINHPVTAAPTTDDDIYIGHTVFFDSDATQQYLDWIMQGRQAGDDIQGIASIGKCNVTGLGIGEVPSLEFDLACGSWQWVTTGSVDMDTTYATEGTSAPTIHEGLFLLTDHSSTPSTAAYDATQLMSCGSVAVDLGIEYVPVEGFNGVNGIDRFQKIRCKPTITCNILIDDAFGGTGTYDALYTDYVNGTAKTVILQIGHTPNNCIAFVMDKCYMSACPKHTSMNGLQAVSIQLTGTQYSANGNDMLDSPITIHWF